MPEWNIDKAVKQLEQAVLRPGAVPGTIWQRTLMDHKLFPSFRLKIPLGRESRECTNVWALGIGELMEPKQFFYGLTMREAYLRARRHFKKELRPRKNSFKKARDKKQEAAPES